MIVKLGLGMLAATTVALAACGNSLGGSDTMTYFIGTGIYMQTAPGASFS